MVQIQVIVHVHTSIPLTEGQNDCIPACNDPLRLLRISGHSSFVRLDFLSMFRMPNSTPDTRDITDYVDQQSFIEKQNHLAAVYNDDFVGIASYNIFVGIAVATIFGAAFFFDLFWPERHESPSVRLSWKICAIVIAVMCFADAIAMTV